MESRRPHLHYESDHHCVNFHGNVQFTPARYCDVWNMWDDSSSQRERRWLPGLLAIQEIIRDAEKQNMPVRAMGANWSLSGAAVTTGCTLNTKPLNVIEVGIAPEHCDSQYLRARQALGEARPADLLVFAQCGATIAELNKELESRGLALSTSGASNGQSICGAMSTGTHGAAWKFGAVQDFILGLHMIGPGGVSVWIEPASRPVMSRSFCDILNAQLVRDDRLFNAALVSFGSFGVIHAVVLKAEPLYVLEQHLVPRHFDAVLDTISDIEHSSRKLLLTNIKGDIPTQPPYHFEVLLNPFAFDVTSTGIKEKQNQTAAYVRFMYKHPPDLKSYSPTHHLLGPDPKTETTSTDAFNFLEKLGDLTPLYAHSGLAADISKSVIEGILQPDNPADHRGKILTPGGMFAATPLTGPGLSCELFFALPDVPKAIEIILRQINAFPLACLPSLRFVGTSAASLAPNCFAPYSCAMEFPAALSPRTLGAYDRIWNALEKQGVRHTFHWGQCLHWGLTPAAARTRLETVFGDRLTHWLDARRSFLDPRSRRTTFSNPMLVDCGLAD